jgi:hypothetical protein
MEPSRTNLSLPRLASIRHGFELQYAYRKNGSIDDLSNCVGFRRTEFLRPDADAFPAREMEWTAG